MQIQIKPGRKCGELSSVSRRRGAAEGGVITGAEAATIFLGGSYGWVAEAGMALDVGREAGVDIAASGLNPVVIALLSDGAELRRRRGHDDNRLRVGTPGDQGDGNQQGSKGGRSKGESCDGAVRHWGTSFVVVSRRRQARRMLD